MPRLFNKSMQVRERAYREGRADEAANDMVLGAKLAALNSMEDAQDKAIGDIASQYSKFLKALQVKEVPIVSTDAGLTAKDKLEKATVEKGIADWNSRTAVSGSTGPTASLTDIYSEMAAKLTTTDPTRRVILDLINSINAGDPPLKILKLIKTKLSPPLFDGFTTIMHDKIKGSDIKFEVSHATRHKLMDDAGFSIRANTKKESRTLNSANLVVLRKALEMLANSQLAN